MWTHSARVLFPARISDSQNDLAEVTALCFLQGEEIAGVAKLSFPQGTRVLKLEGLLIFMSLNYAVLILIQKQKHPVRFGSQGLWEAVKARSKEFPTRRFVATFPCMTSATFSKSRCVQIIPLMPSRCLRKGRGSISSSFQDTGVTAMERPFSAVSFPETPCIISLSSLACFVGIYWLNIVYALGRKYCFC